MVIKRPRLGILQIQLRFRILVSRSLFYALRIRHQQVVKWTNPSNTCMLVTVVNIHIRSSSISMTPIHPSAVCKVNLNMLILDSTTNSDYDSTKDLCSIARICGLKGSRPWPSCIVLHTEGSVITMFGKSASPMSEIACHCFSMGSSPLGLWMCKWLSRGNCAMSSLLMRSLVLSISTAITINVTLPAEATQTPISGSKSVFLTHQFQSIYAWLFQDTRIQHVQKYSVAYIGSCKTLLELCLRLLLPMWMISIVCCVHETQDYPKIFKLTVR